MEESNPKFSKDQCAAYRKAFAAEATDDQFTLFMLECERRNLVPGTHVVMQLRSSREFSDQLGREVYVKKPIFITTINALRLIAERSGNYEGRGPFAYYYMNDEQKLEQSQIPLGRVPHAVSVLMHRRGWKEPVLSVARFEAYAQYRKGDGGKPTLTAVWATRGEEQLAKCAEAQGLRTVSPEETGGLYISEEMKDDDDRQEAQQAAPFQMSTSTTTVGMPPLAPTIIPVTLPGPVNNEPAQKVADEQSRPEPKPEPPKPEPQAKINIHGVAVTDDDLPDIFGDKGAQAAPEPSATQKPAPEAKKAEATPTGAAQGPAAATGDMDKPWGGAFEPKPPSPVPADKPMTPAEYTELITRRGGNLVHDKLPKGGLKDSLALCRYLTKRAGVTRLQKAPPAPVRAAIEELEAATPEAAVKIIMEGQ